MADDRAYQSTLGDAVCGGLVTAGCLCVGLALGLDRLGPGAPGFGHKQTILLIVGVALFISGFVLRFTPVAVPAARLTGYVAGAASAAMVMLLAGGLLRVEKRTQECVQTSVEAVTRRLGDLGERLDAIAELPSRGCLLSKLEYPVVPVGPSDAWDCWQVSEPSIVFDGSEYRLYYEGLGRQDKSWRIGYAASKDLIHWQRASHNPVLEPDPSLEWADEDVMEPFVLKDGDVYKLWFTADWHATERTEIGYATSPDGIRWTIAREPVISFELLRRCGLGFTGASEPSVLRRRGARDWVMYFQAFRDGISHIAYAVSEDGLSWTIPAYHNPVIEASGGSEEWDSAGVAGPCVEYHEGRYWLFYNSWRSRHRGRSERIGVAWSKDGTNFARFHDNPILSSSDDPLKWDHASVYEPAVLLADDGSLSLFFGGSCRYTTPAGKTETKELQLGLAVGELPRAPKGSLP